MICEGDYGMDKQWDPKINPLNKVNSLLSLLLISVNLTLSFKTYKRRKQIEKDENRNSKNNTLKYVIMVPSGINVPPGKLGKKNNRAPWNYRTHWKTMRSYQY